MESISITNQTKFESIKDFLKYISTSENEFWKTVDKHRSPHLWEINEGEWKLRNKVFEI